MGESNRKWSLEEGDKDASEWRLKPSGSDHLELQLDVIGTVAFGFRKLHHENPQQRQSVLVQELLQARRVLSVLLA